MFNLNNKIRDWRSVLLRDKGLSNSEVDELESHLQDSIEEIAVLPISEEKSYLLALYRMGSEDVIANEFQKNSGSNFSPQFMPTPHVYQDGSEDHYVYAYIPLRAIAAITDSAIILALTLITDSAISSISIIWTSAMLVLLPVVILCYLVGFTYYLGTTPGLLMAGIRVTRPDGSRLCLKQTMIRFAPEFIYYLISIPLLLNGLHDNETDFFLTNRPTLFSDICDNTVTNCLAGPRIDYLFNYQTLPLVVLRQIENIWNICNGFAIFLNKRRRTLMDYLSKTIVVNKQYAVIANGNKTIYPVAPASLLN